MAVILEIVHPNGARSWRRLDALPLTLGRGLANDLILDDPYVDPAHARIAIDESGALRIEDLGSVNGIVTSDARSRSAIAVEPGTEVRVGRTTLRFRDPQEPVSPAIVDDSPVPGVAPSTAAAPKASVPARRGLAWVTTRRGQIAIVASTVLIFALITWLEDSTSSAASAFSMGASIFFVMAAVWAGGWALASRAIVHRANFLGHLAVVSSVALISLAWNSVENWLRFFFPDAALIEVLSTVTLIGVLVLLLIGHLSLASNMPRQRRRRLSVGIPLFAVAFGGLMALAMDDSFTDVATFPGQLKPVPPSWIPAATVDEFSEVMLELKKDVDEETGKLNASKKTGEAGPDSTR